MRKEMSVYVQGTVVLYIQHAAVLLQHLSRFKLHSCFWSLKVTHSGTIKKQLDEL